MPTGRAVPGGRVVCREGGDADRKDAVAMSPAIIEPAGPDLPGPATPATPSWSERYGRRHRLVRVADFPAGVAAPRKVRLYHRLDHYVLQWWDSGAKQNLSDRIDGDLVSAIARTRQIEEKLAHFRSAGQGKRRLTHEDLTARFIADLHRRANAGAVDPATVRRYTAALAHYGAFCARPETQKAYPHVAGVNRDFRLAFAAFLAGRRTPPNGHPNAAARPMKGQAFVLDAVRALLEWAADPDRGNLLPDGFRNPFRRRGEPRPVFNRDPLAEPDITLTMALDFVRACDRYQLRLFAPMLLFGLRAAEPCFLFVEYLDGDWLRVPCNADLAYRTKGRRDKRFPLIADLRPLWEALRNGRAQGLLYERRPAAEGREKAALRGASLADLVEEFRGRCAAGQAPNAAGRLRLRDVLLKEAGGVGYDRIQQEFGGLARKLGWPAAATLKDFRHLFCTTLGNAAMPEAYRRYLMGHSPEKAAVAAYTHLNELRRHYGEAVRREWAPLVAVILERLQALRTA
jgi:hypothetical protein